MIGKVIISNEKDECGVFESEDAFFTNTYNVNTVIDALGQTKRTLEGGVNPNLHLDLYVWIKDGTEIEKIKKINDGTRIKVYIQKFGYKDTTDDIVVQGRIFITRIENDKILVSFNQLNYIKTRLVTYHRNYNPVLKRWENWEKKENSSPFQEMEFSRDNIF